MGSKVKKSIDYIPLKRNKPKGVNLVNDITSSISCAELFPSVGTDVVKHYNTVGVHRSFPQGVVS